MSGSREKSGEILETAEQRDARKSKYQNEIVCLRVRDSKRTLILCNVLIQNDIWLGGRDSNPDTVVQSHVSYRWTTSQCQSRRVETQELPILANPERDQQAASGAGHRPSIVAACSVTRRRNGRPDTSRQD